MQVMKWMRPLKMCPFADVITRRHRATSTLIKQCHVVFHLSQSFERTLVENVRICRALNYVLPVQKHLNEARYCQKLKCRVFLCSFLFADLHWRRTRVVSPRCTVRRCEKTVCSTSNQALQQHQLVFRLRQVPAITILKGREMRKLLLPGRTAQ